MARGSVIKRGNSYLLRVDTGKDIDGKRKWHTESFKTKKEAEKRLGEILNQVNTGTYIKPEKMTFGELLDVFIENRRNNLAKKTIEGYETIIIHHLKPELGHIPTSELRPLHIEQYLNKTETEGRKDGKKDKLSKTTLLHHYRLIHTVLEYAVKREMLARNVAKPIEPPKPDTKEMQILSREEIGRLLDYLKNDQVLYMPTFLAVYTGMRLSEILGLTWDDINLQEGFIHIRQALKYTKKEGLLFEAPKTPKSKRIVEISTAVIEALKKHKTYQKELALKSGKGKKFNAHNLVFCRKDGEPLIPNNFASRIKRIMKKLGIQGSFHTLRHTHISYLIDMGIDLKSVSARAGHSNITTTADTYGHIIRRKQKEIAQKYEEYMAGNM